MTLPAVTLREVTTETVRDLGYGFVETGEVDGDERVIRLELA